MQSCPPLRVRRLAAGEPHSRLALHRAGLTAAARPDQGVREDAQVRDGGHVTQVTGL